MADDGMRERIIAVLGAALPHVDFEGSASLVDDGILDSISIVTAVGELALEFGVEFNLDELAPENLNSVDAMAETVRSLMARQGRA